MDYRDRNLAQALIRNSEDGDFRNLGAGVALGFDLCRRDILAAANDDLFLPIDDEQIAVFVEITDVAAPQVAVRRKQSFRRFGIAEVAANVRSAADCDLASLAGRKVVVTFAEDSQLDERLLRAPGRGGLRGVVAPIVCTSGRVGFR